MARTRRYPPEAAPLPEALTLLASSISGVRTRLDARVATSPPGAYREETFTLAGAETPAWIDNTSAPLSIYSLGLRPVGGAPTAWDIFLEGSLDGVGAYTILRHSDLLGHSLTTFLFPAAGVRTPFRYHRLRSAGVTLAGATSLVACALGVP